MSEPEAEAPAHYLLDTNMISPLMHGPQGEVARRLQSAQQAAVDVRVNTSLIVANEIGFGLERQPLAALQEAYDHATQVIKILPLDQAVVPHYACIRRYLLCKGTHISPNDTVIAAHALALGAILVTDNEDEFRRVPGLKV